MDSVNSISDSRALGGGMLEGRKRWFTGDFFKIKSILYEILMMDTCCYAFVKTDRKCNRVRPNVNYGL